MHQIFKGFEVAGDQMATKELKTLAAELAAVWIKELQDEGLRVVSTDCTLEARPNSFHDPRYITLTVGLWVEKMENPS